MHWSEQVLRYCERGQETGLLAEPLNAASNIAFLVAALAAARTHAAQPARAGDATVAVVRLLIALVALIGLGSLVFHMLATRWAQLADVVPIAAFMLLYLAFALRVLLGCGWTGVALGLGAFVLALAIALAVCAPGEASLSPLCLNGTLGYAPALLALAGVGMALRTRRHPAAGAMLTAAGVLAVAMAMRSADMAACAATELAGHPRGLHVLWHLLNAAALYLLMKAAVKTVGAVPRCQDRPDAA